MTRLKRCEGDWIKKGASRNKPGFETLFDIEVGRWLVKHVYVSLLHAARGALV